jgi:diguanylate cyclase (GGDEF)-like protein
MHENIRRKRGIWRTYNRIPGLGFSTTCVLAAEPHEMWLGTENGIAIWDGRHHRLLSGGNGLPDNNVQCLFKDSRRHIWIGTAGGLASYRHGVLTPVTEEDGLPAGSVRAVAELSDGSIWIGVNGRGIYRKTGSSYTRLAGSDKLDGTEILCMTADREDLWIGTSNGLFHFDGSSLLDLSEELNLPSRQVWAVLRDRSGALWIGTNRGLVKNTGDRTENLSADPACNISNVRMIREDREGNVWVLSYMQGVCCFGDEGPVTFKTMDGLAGNTVLCLSQEQNGTIWFACRFGGFCSYNPYEMVLQADEAVSEVMIRTRRSRQYLWGTESGLTVMSGDTLEHIRRPGAVMAILEDSRGRIWLSIHGFGVQLYNSADCIGKKRPRRIAAREGLTSNEVWRFFEDSEGRIWIGSADGVYLYTDRIVRHITTDDGLAHRFVSAIAEDTQGTIWLGGWQGGGLSVYTDGAVQPFMNNGNLASDAIVDLLAEPDGSLLAGTVAGLFRITGGRTLGNIAPYFSTDDLPSSRIQRLRRTTGGQLLVCTLGGGLIRSDGRNYQILTTEDHLPSTCVTGCIENDDGSLMISTYRGVLRYVPIRSQAPDVTIDELVADRAYRNTSDVTIYGRNIPITVRFHGSCTRTGRMRYSYMLEGFDASWTSTWSEEIRYEDLPEGSYCFKVKAINKDLVYSQGCAEVRFTLVRNAKDRIITDLESIVEDRTRELQDALDRLEQLNRNLRTISLQDDLTGLYNRRGFLTLGRQHFKHSVRTGDPFLVCFADMDDLKTINDSCGHDKGDEAILKTAEILQYTFRDEDILARIGGDEFTILVAGAVLGDLESIKERLTRCLEKYNEQAGRPYRLALSIGGSQFVPGKTASLEDLMTEADWHLYNEKRLKKTKAAGRY